MPTPENDAIGPNERFIRLLWCHSFKGNVPHQNWFKPRDDEDTGISLFRESCLEDPLDCLKAIPVVEKRDYYAIVAYPLIAFTSRQMSFALDPIPEAPGHVVLTDVTPISWKADERNLRYRISELASVSERCVIRNPIRTDYKPPQK